MTCENRRAFEAFKAGNDSQPLFKAIQFDVDVGTGEFLVVTEAKGKCPILNSKLQSADERP